MNAAIIQCNSAATLYTADAAWALPNRTLADSEATRSWNVSRLRLCDVVSIILTSIMSDSAMPMRVLKQVTQLIEVAMSDQCRRADVQSLVAFLVGGLGVHHPDATTDHQIKSQSAMPPSTAQRERANWQKSQHDRTASAMSSSTSSSSVTGLRAFLLRSDVDERHTIGAQMGVRIFDLLSKVAMHIIQQPDSDEKTNELAALTDACDIKFFSLFLWPDVHSTVISSALRFLSVLLCGSASFKQTFTAPPTTNDQTNIMPPSLLTSSSSSSASSNVATTINNAVNTIATSISNINNINNNNIANKLVVTSGGFLMLMERLPYCRPHFDVYTILFGLLLGKTAVTSSGASNVSQSFELFTLIEQFLTHNNDSPMINKSHQRTLSTSSLQQDNGNNIHNNSNNKDQLDNDWVAVNTVFFSEALAVLLSLLRESAKDLLDEADELAKDNVAQAQADTSNNAATSTTTSTNPVSQQPSPPPRPLIRSNSTPFLSSAARLTRSQLRAASNDHCQIIVVCIQFIGVIFKHSDDVQREIYAQSYIDKIVDCLLFTIQRIGKQAELVDATEADNNERPRSRSTASPVDPSPSPPNTPSPTGDAATDVDVKQIVPVVTAICDLLSTLITHALLTEQRSAVIPMATPLSPISSPPSTPSHSASSASASAANTVPQSLSLTDAVKSSYRRILDTIPPSTSPVQVNSYQCKLISLLIDRIHSMLQGGLPYCIAHPNLLPNLESLMDFITQSLDVAAINPSALKHPHLNVQAVLDCAIQALALSVQYNAHLQQLAAAAAAESSSSMMTPMKNIRAFLNRNMASDPSATPSASAASGATAGSGSNMSGSASGSKRPVNVEMLRASCHRLILLVLADSYHIQDTVTGTKYILTKIIDNIVVLLPEDKTVTAASTTSAANTTAPTASAATNNTNDYPMKPFLLGLSYHLYHFLLHENIEIRHLTFIIWELLLIRHFNFIKKILLHKSNTTTKTYDLYKDGFSKLIHSNINNKYENFQNWLNKNTIDLTVVFDETIFLYYRENFLEIKKKLNYYFLNNFLNKQIDLLELQHLNNATIITLREILYRERNKNIFILQQKDNDRNIRRRRELNYRQNEINRHFLFLIKNLQFQSIFFIHSLFLKYYSCSSQRSYLSKSITSTGVTSPAAPTRIPPLSSSDAHVIIPLSSYNESKVLDDYIRYGLLPPRRWRLDAHEGALRQRKKLLLDDDFYKSYKLILLPLLTALAMYQINPIIPFSVPIQVIKPGKTLVTNTTEILNIYSNNNNNNYYSAEKSQNNNNVSSTVVSSSSSTSTSPVDVAALPSIDTSSTVSDSSTRVSDEGDVINSPLSPPSPREHEQDDAALVKPVIPISLLHVKVDDENDDTQTADDDDDYSSDDDESKMSATSSPPSEVKVDMAVTPRSPATGSTETAQSGWSGVKNRRFQLLQQAMQKTIDIDDANVERNTPNIVTPNSSRPDISHKRTSSSSVAVASANDSSSSAEKTADGRLSIKVLNANDKTNTNDSSAVAGAPSDLPLADDLRKDQSPFSDTASLNSSADVSNATVIDDLSYGDESVGEYERLLRLLEPGDNVIADGLFACHRISGLDKHTAVLVMCTQNMYIIDGFVLLPTGELQTVLPIDDKSQPHYTVTVASRQHSSPWTSSLNPDAEPTVKQPPVAALLPDGSLDLSELDVVIQVHKLKKNSDEAAMVAALTAYELSKMQSDSDFHACIKLNYAQIRQVSAIRFQLMAIGLELFYADGSNLLLAFESKQERELVYDKIMHMYEQAKNDDLSSALFASQTLETTSTVFHGTVMGGRSVLKQWQKSLTQRWCAGEMSNFAYLMAVNTLAGRTYNDLTQYPIMPWVLSDYTSPFLDLDDERVYRDLSKPMGAIGKDRAKSFADRYENWVDPSGVIPKFHYGTHYSSAATVLYYLIRLEPFTRAALALQGGKFDHADRLFFEINHTWTSASSQGGLSDVKELIPEFYYLPECLMNNGRFDLGEHQKGGYVGDVILPPWARNDARIFVRYMRRALESKYVSANLHRWIDLIFGYKQRGKAAVEALNVFYYLTYEDVVDVNAITDPIQKQATIDQINNFGQTPHQLFKKPHPPRQAQDKDKMTVAMHPRLLHQAPPTSQPAQLGTGRPIAGIYYVSRNDKLLILDENKCILAGKLSRYLSWGHIDHSLRICVLQVSTRHRVLHEAVTVHEGLHDGQISKVLATDDQQYIITGGEDGLVNVWRGASKSKFKQLSLARSLCGHTAAITALYASSSYSVLISGSSNCQVLVWDLNRLSLTRRLPIHPAPISAVAVNDLTGDIVTAAGVHLFVWAINGDLVAYVRTGDHGADDAITAVAYSCGPDHDEACIITGHHNGHIRLWSLMIPDDPSVCLSPAANRPILHGTDRDGLRTTKLNSNSFANANANTTESVSGEVVVDDALIKTAFLSIELRHALAPTSNSAESSDGLIRHTSPITCVHASVTEARRIWSGDSHGVVICWQLNQADHWVKDSEVKNCTKCHRLFTVIERRHHCRNCGLLFCHRDSSQRVPLPQLGFLQPVRVCDNCFQLVLDKK